MSRFFKEPLVHFLVLGAALFALYTYLGEDEAQEGERIISVSSGRIEQLAAIFSKTWQRPPNREELAGLIDDFVLEEIYYREALQMGIEQDDVMIRRRLRQKLEFLTEDIANQVSPSDDQLEAYLAENPERFQREPTYTFRQHYFKPENHGDDPEAAVSTLAVKLRAGESVLGDRTLLPESLDNAPARTVDGIFGSGFASRLDDLEPATWSDPISSGFGWHLVRLEKRTPGRLPNLDEIRPAVEREWANLNRSKARQQFDEALRANYEVTIEWPSPAGSPPVETSGEAPQSSEES